jgi:uncharacterized protein YecA (UPF0149 family)
MELNPTGSVLLPWEEVPEARGRWRRDREAWPKVDRNGPCPCGSGEKYNKCCMGKAS